MRIIAGKLGGRLFDSPGTFKTHPMSDKARGALFNILGDIHGLTVLDPFAGTGAISFEAISRGARTAMAIEQDKTAQKIITQNSARLGLNKQVRLIRASANAWLQTNPEVCFDIVVCDPPYNDLQTNLLQQLALRVVKQGLFVLSFPSATPVPIFENLEHIDSRKYGDLTLHFYRNLM